MAATNAQVRAALFDAITMDGVHAYEYPPDTIEAPAAVVAGFDYAPSTFGEGRQMDATVLVAVSRSHVDHLACLDQMLDDTGDTSTVAAINAAVVDDISFAVTNVGSYGDVQFGDVAYYGAVITVSVLT